MKIIIPIIVGSIIGYFTNWLAIKMLFRPLKAKKILGIKVPFTPGLIPKERGRMAKSIGEAVGMHLLTPEKIAEVVSSKETKEKIEEFIKFKINTLKESEKDLNSFLTSVSYKFPVDRISERIFKLFSKKLKEKEVKYKLSLFLQEHIYPKYKDRLVRKISDNGNRYLERIKNSKSLEDMILKDINNKLNRLKDTDIILSDIIDDNLIIKLEDSIYMNKKNIMNSLRELFYKEDIQKALLSSIENLVELNLSKMITMFIDSKTISEKIFEVIKKYIDSEQAEEAASFIIKDSIKNLLNTEVYTIIEKSNSILDENDVLNLYKKTLDHIFKEENQEKILNLIIDNINGNEKLIKDKIDYTFKKSIEDILESESFESIFKEEINKSLNKILNTSFKDLLKDLDEKTLEKVFEFANNIINIGFKEEIFNIINLFDISKVVEDEINSFEVEYTEKLILKIADRELKAITRLGALLGAIMGLLMPILQMI
ncbi:MAG: DUF445 family protein [Tissierella sp.]|uniref:DUF445 family protein n=1 Tax=Tissierella sp. TaxID=41274 RepID=UPI003F9DABF8